MTLHVLLAEPHPEETLFLNDVLLEIECGRHWTNWVHINILQAGTVAEATGILSGEYVDVVLLNLDLDSDQAQGHGAHTFRRIQAAAPQVPIVILADEADQALAMTLIREGAQDFLIKNKVDCEPLAHAIRNAIERHRLLTASRSSSILDPLTGLYNRCGFMALADRDRKLAERLGRRLSILVTEPNHFAEIEETDGSQRRDLMLIEAADRLRFLVGPTDLIGRIDSLRFALAIFDTEFESAEETWARIHSSTESLRIGAAIFDSSRPCSLEALLDQATRDLAPKALAMRR
jgi:two-component system cell cycle response regulator